MTRRLMKYAGVDPATGKDVYLTTSCGTTGTRRLLRDTGEVDPATGKKVYEFADCTSRDLGRFPSCVTIPCCPDPIYATLYLRLSAPSIACLNGQIIPLTYNSITGVWESGGVSLCSNTGYGFRLRCNLAGGGPWELEVSNGPNFPGGCEFYSGGTHAASFTLLTTAICTPFFGDFGAMTYGTGGIVCSAAGSPATVGFTVSDSQTGGGSGSGSGTRCLGDQSWRTVGSCCVDGLGRHLANPLPPTLCAFLRKLIIYNCDGVSSVSLINPCSPVIDGGIVARTTAVWTDNPLADYWAPGYWYGKFDQPDSPCPTIGFRLLGGATGLHGGMACDATASDVVPSNGGNNAGTGCNAAGGVFQCKPYWFSFGIGGGTGLICFGFQCNHREGPNYVQYVIEITNPAETGNQGCADPIYHDRGSPPGGGASGGASGGGRSYTASPVTFSHAAYGRATMKYAGRDPTTGEAVWLKACCPARSGSGSGEDGTLIPNACCPDGTPATLNVTFHGVSGTCGMDGQTFQIHWDSGTEWIGTVTVPIGGGSSITWECFLDCGGKWGINIGDWGNTSDGTGIVDGVDADTCSPFHLTVTGFHTPPSYVVCPDWFFTLVVTAP